MRFASRHPERVSKLVALAPGGVVPVRPWYLVQAIVLSALGRRGIEAISRITMGRQPIHPVGMEFMNLVITHFTARKSPLPILAEAELKGLTMPTLLISGGHDALFPAAKMVARMKKCVPGIRTVLLPDWGHALVGLAEIILPHLSGEVTPLAGHLPQSQ